MKNKKNCVTWKFAFFAPFGPFISKTVNDMKNAWGDFYYIFYKESFRKKPHQIPIKNKQV